MVPIGKLTAMNENSIMMNRVLQWINLFTSLVSEKLYYHCLDKVHSVQNKITIMVMVSISTYQKSVSVKSKFTILHMSYFYKGNLKTDGTGIPAIHGFSATNEIN